MGKIDETDIKNVLTQIAYYCFYVGVIIEVLLVLIDKSAYTNPAEGRIFQVTFLLFVLKVLLTRYSSKEWLIIFLFAGLGAVSYFSTERNEIIRMVIFIAACKDIDMKKCLKLVFFLTLVGCIAIMLLSLTGIYGKLSLTQDYGRGGMETRYTLGMGHPNALQCMVFSLILLYFYLYAGRLKIISFICAFLVNIFSFALTNSRTGFLILLLTIVMALVLERGKRFQKKKWVYAIGMVGIVLCVLFSVFISYNSRNVIYYPILGKIDSLLSGRIRVLYYDNVYHAGTLETWSLFSNRNNYHYFDMGWIRLFFWYGIISGAIYTLCILLLIHFMYKKSDYMGLVLVIMISIYTVFEAHFISVYIARNYLLFLMGEYWYRCFWISSNNVFKKG